MARSLPGGRRRAILFPLSLLAAILIFPTQVFPAQAQASDAVYRFWSEPLRTHFYTSSQAERDAIVAELSQIWRLEGAVWSAGMAVPDPRLRPVHRFRWQRLGRHFYTIDPAEKEHILAELPDWVYEGVAWYAYPEARPGTLPVYRFWNPALRTHVYILDENERTQILAEHPDWIAEGIAWHAYPFLGERAAIDLAWVPGGCFELGSRPSAAWRGHDEDLYPICVDDFLIGRFEVTQAQWQLVMGNRPSWWFHNCPDCPVEMVSWHDAEEFLRALNAMTGRAYRLPTEAEWEYACREGGQSRTYCGAGQDLWPLAWYRGNSGGRPRPVGERQPNALGIYDMSGNVAEWTCSPYASSYADGANLCAGAHDHGYRVVRGGSWAQEAHETRSARREAQRSRARLQHIGLRVAHD